MKDDRGIFITFKTPKHPIGTRFTYRGKYGNYPATIIGYNLEHHTDNQITNATYRIKYNYQNLQDVAKTVPRAVVDLSIIKQQRLSHNELTKLKECDGKHSTVDELFQCESCSVILQETRQ